MKISFCFAILITYSTCSVGQKPPLDSTALEKWPSLGYKLDISCDGSYFVYAIDNWPQGSSTLVLQASNGSWKKEFTGVLDGFFSGDSKHFVFKRNDTVGILLLGTDSIYTISRVAFYKRPGSSREQWFAYKLNNSSKDFIVRNLIAGREQTFSNVKDCLFNQSGTELLIKRVVDGANRSKCELILVDLLDNSSRKIWASEDSLSSFSSVKDFVFDSEGQQLVFVQQLGIQSAIDHIIWYYKKGMDGAVRKVVARSPGIDSGMIVGGYPTFSKNGRWIFVKLDRVPNIIKPSADAVKVDIWNYKDSVLQSEQANPTSPPATEYFAVIGVDSSRVVQITHGKEEIAMTNKSDFVVVSDGQYVVKNGITRLDYYYLVRLQDGSRRLLSTCATDMTMSPEGRYVAFFDGKKKNYFVYDILGEEFRNLSLAIPTRLDNEYMSASISTSRIANPVGAATWIGDSALVIYDNYDIWKLDPGGNRSPVNVTNGFGRARNIKFRLAHQADVYQVTAERDGPALLTAFDVLNKNNGFYSSNLSEARNPTLLAMGRNIYLIDDKLGSQTPSESLHSPYYGMLPVKARDSAIWIVKRCSATEAPNYFLTRNFRDYKALTNLQPQKEYNWLTTELINWKQLDGTISQGILYRPENFDRNRKYPLIFNYYEQLSFDLNAYLVPKFSKDEINIPWFVSRGYLVFVPDIHFSIARISGKVNGEHAFNSIVSAARYFAKKPWVDSAKMGIDGWSFGGAETNYVIAHTSMFAAAAEAAGTSDEISSYLSLGGGYGTPRGSRIEAAESGQGRLGASLWQRPDLFFKYSPILRINKVTTPLLILHNKGDFAVPWEQGIELFLALRRLGKKVWLLQYDHGQHSVFGKDARDYTIRLTQFFDFYLRGGPPPKWMTEGVPTRLRGIETGYELDKSGKIP